MIGMILLGIAVAFGGFVWQTALGGINRKIVARVQKRYGPKWYQEFIDIFKLLSSSNLLFKINYVPGVSNAAATVEDTTRKSFDSIDVIVNIYPFLSPNAVPLPASAVSTINPKSLPNILYTPIAATAINATMIRYSVMPWPRCCFLIFLFKFQ